jgi:hypothetical protein
MPDSKINEKLDIALREAFSAWEQTQDPKAGISVSLHFDGDLASIEALGFETAMVSSGIAVGVVYFKDIPALVAHPGVLWIASGRRHKVSLNTAARDIRARASAPLGGAPLDGLWHAGLIALMLDKKNDLNITQARAALFSAPRAAVAPSIAPASTNAYGQGRVDAMSSHSSTP